MPRLSKIGAAALAAFGFSSGAAAVTASYLVVAGGGGGGYQKAAGGGAGGYLTGTTSLVLTTSYTVTVGAGGSGATSKINPATLNGSNSTFGSLTAAVGGGGGASSDSADNTINTGASGGSGGGGASYSAVQGSGGTGTSGQGNAGGAGSTDNSTYRTSGGGGGAGAVGANGSPSSGGNGGNGVSSSISGTATYYAGGGGSGKGDVATAGSGGSGGGGAGGTSGTGSNGSANLGGGGGGGAVNASNGGNGGSGIVIISYTGTQQFGGGTVTSSGGNTIHTFTSSGVLSPLSSLSASYLIVAGGGGGGQRGGGGGGAGGYQTSSVTIDTNSIYTITVGAGGAGAATSGSGNNGTVGSNSNFLATTSAGGGYGGAFIVTTYNAGGAGGSGGGGCAGFSNTGAAAGGSGNTPSTSPSQGSNGGSGINGPAGTASAGGGGGSSATGQTAPSTGQGGAGGAGTASSITGSSVTYAGGGGGAGNTTGGAGGSGGGGAGTSGTTNGVAGTANTGGGGGGGRNDTDGTSTAGGAGGSGVVIISYAGATQSMAGGTVTIVGGNVIHTFTSSGYLTPLTYYSNSLRFRSSATAYLSRTPATTGSATTFTWSGWVKRGQIGSTNATQWLFNGGSAVNTLLGFGQINLDDLSGNLRGTGGTNYFFATNAVFRDPAAWYHIVWAVDTTQATSSDRMKLYVNGNLQTLSTANYPTQNLTLLTASTRYIGADTPNSRYYFDGYMSNINFIDGQQLTPNSFGTFNSYGVWQPINYGGSYGTNGFYLPFNSGSETYAASFNGSTQNLLTSTNANLALGTNNFTVEYWINPISTPSGAVPVSAGGGTVTYDPLFGYQPASTATTLYLSSTGTSFDIRSGGALATTPIGVWTHVAITRSGSTFYTFCNGVQTSTFTSSASIYQSANSFSIGKAQGNSITNAYISNVRVVIGSAVYTSNFVPSTTALTAITNTQLLTLQNATIIDNSTNATAITNNGTVATATAKPLSTAVFQDQSPQGNNWTPSAISGLSGSTLDYMTDVPTLTSATAANYAVLNPLSTTTGTYSNGNLQFVGPSAWKNALSTIQIPTTDKWYWEATIIGTVYTPRGSTTGNNATGILPATTFDSATNPNTTTSGLFILDSGYIKNFSTTIADMGSAFVNGDVIGVAIDTTNNTYQFYKNNSSVGSGTINNTAGTPYVAVLASYYGTYSPFAMNFGQRPFTYTPPSGFVALNTYNL